MHKNPFYALFTRAAVRANVLIRNLLGTPEPIEILAAGVVGETYTIDIIDNYSGGPPNFELSQRTFTWSVPISTVTVSYRFEQLK